MNRLVVLFVFAILIAACATQSVEQQDIPEAEVRAAPTRVEFPEGIPAPVGSVNDFAELRSQMPGASYLRRGPMGSWLQ